MSSEMPDLGRAHILIVDDKPENLKILASILTEQGYKVRGAISGELALRSAFSKPPGLILLDVMMPEMDGFEVCTVLKKEPNTCEIPVIFLSALSETEEKIKAFQAGGIDYITKPFQLEEVLARVAIHMRLHESQVQIKQMNETLEVRVQERTAQLEAINQHLQDMILQDLLTGLPNRTFFLERMQQILQHIQTTPDLVGPRFALLFLDCDGFKLINDSLGHLAGDRLLIAMGQRLQATLVPGQTLIRLSGDEFLVLLENLAQPQETPPQVAQQVAQQMAQQVAQQMAQQVAQKLLKAYEQAFYTDGQEIFLSASIGIVVGGAEYDKPEHILRDADIAMYQAKAMGKGTFAVFRHEMHRQVLERLHLETTLRYALDRQELQLYYQPIVSLQTHAIQGFEALLRWQSPERGLVRPDDFITVAEETGLILPMGRWVIEQACRQLQTWYSDFGLIPRRYHPHLYISVNLSLRQISDAYLLAHLDRVLGQTNIQGGLVLELTESIMMHDVQSTQALLRQFQQRAVRLSIDDFGQGYSSLGYLHDLPVDVIKIDRAFVSGTSITTDLHPKPGSDKPGLKKTDNLARSAIVKTILSLAQSLGVSVVAEGIETECQSRQLYELGCTAGQGYWFSEPVPAAAATELLRRSLQRIPQHQAR
jgi:diguanylate cyclase (GGDEF)-like protein